MAEVTAKASPLLLYGGLATAFPLFVLVAILAFLNRGSEEVFEIVRPMVLAILLASAYLASTLILSAPVKQETKVQVAVYRKQDRALINFIGVAQDLGHTASQAVLKLTMAEWESAVRASAQLQMLVRGDLRAEADFFLDVLEVALFEWLRLEYGSHWDVLPLSSTGLSSAIRKNEVRPDAAATFVGIPVDAIESLLAGNQLVKIGGAFGRRLAPPEIQKIQRERIWFVPADSKLNVERSPMMRTLHLTGPYSNLRIEIRHLWNLEKIGGTGFSDRLAERLKLTALERDQALGHVYEVVFSQVRPRLKRWAPEAIRQASWASDMAKRFAADFGWDGMLQDLEKADLHFR